MIKVMSFNNLRAVLSCTFSNYYSEANNVKIKFAFLECTNRHEEKGVYSILGGQAKSVVMVHIVNGC